MPDLIGHLIIVHPAKPSLVEPWPDGVSEGVQPWNRPFSWPDGTGGTACYYCIFSRKAENL
jgi:hypothetical protein